jgi:hypothetical protein
MISFFFMYNGSILLTILYCYPFVSYNIWTIISAILFFLGLAMYFITFLLGPGIMMIYILY